MTVTNTYDNLGRLLTRSYPDGGIERFGYSAKGLTAYTNQINATNFFAFDELGVKTYETNANGEVVKYTNNAAGDLLSLTDGKNQTTVWKYDEFGRVTNKLDQASAVVLKYFYDAENRLTNRWSVTMGATYYTNDPVGNLTYIKYPFGTSVNLQYDPLNRLTNMVDASGTTKYIYTAGNQVLTEIQPFASSTVTNTYVNRLRTSMVLQQPTGLWTNKFMYDLAGRLTNVTSPAGAFGYTAGGASPGSLLIKKLALPNSSYITNTYDIVARLTGTYLNNSANSVLDSAVYGYDKANERTAFTNAAGIFVQYAYDKIGQLKVATSSTAGENRGYAYDAAWNISYVTNNGTPVGYSVDGKNELTLANGFALAYDTNGNRVTNNNDLVYSYDAENRVTQITDTVFKNFETILVYDGMSRLRSRNEYTWNGSKWTLASTTTYVYDGKRVIQERDGSNNPLVSYTRGTDLSGSLEGAGGIGGLLARSSGYSSGNWTGNHFYHADGSGNITYLVDATQAMAATYRYDPYGNTLSSSGTMSGTNVYRFSSKEVHLNTGMYVYLYRLYDPWSYRWLNRDPLGERATLNLYRFCRNAPLRRVDPYGLQDPGEGTGWGGTGTYPGGDGPIDHDGEHGDEDDIPYTFTMEYGYGLLGQLSGQICGGILNWLTTPPPPGPPVGFNTNPSMGGIIIPVPPPPPPEPPGGYNTNPSMGGIIPPLHPRSYRDRHLL